ncbi:hypothetical protein MMC13_004594 [Lambiella insularis]|nr:hypothetical protein [Lambiella insularis]
MALSILRVVIGSMLVYHYICEGDLEGVRKELNDNVSSIYDIENTSGRSLLLYAIDRGTPDMCKYLLQAGVDPRIEDFHKRSAVGALMNLVVMEIDADYAELASRFSGEDWSTNMRFSTLHRAVLNLSDNDLQPHSKSSQNLMNVQTVLDESTLCIDDRDAYGKTALYWAVEQRNLALVDVLLQRGADPNASKYQRSALHSARAHPEILTLLVKHGADVRSSDYEGMTVLHCVSWAQENQKAVKLLIDHGAIVDARSVHGNTPLMDAVMGYQVENVRCLLQNGANINAMDLRGYTPLFYAIQWNSHACIGILLNQGADCSHFALNTGTLLHMAACNSDVETFKLLTAAQLKDIDVDLDVRGMTAFGWLQCRGDCTQELEEAFLDLYWSIKGTGFNNLAAEEVDDEEEADSDPRIPAEDIEFREDAYSFEEQQDPDWNTYLEQWGVPWAPLPHLPIDPMRSSKFILKVERKFRCSPRSISLLRHNGGDPPFQELTYLGQHRFHDTYYDSNNTLSGNGVWIRRRSGVWQAKVRQGGDFINSKFGELVGKDQIRRLIAQYGVRTSESDDFGLSTIAQYVTERERWKADGTFEIAIDTTDFDHTVGEVEMSVEDPNTGSNEAVTSRMDAQIEAFMEKYSWAFPSGVTVGKLSAYFAQTAAL